MEVQSKRLDDMGRLVRGSVTNLREALDPIQRTTAQIKDVHREFGASSADAGQIAQSLPHMMRYLTDAARQMEILNQTSSAAMSDAERIQVVAHSARMLALNATIEAARAGDMGHGFAVVAGEMKGLSLQTAALAEGIQASMQGLDDLVARLSEDAQKGRELGDGAAARATSITDVTHAALNVFEPAIERLEQSIGTTGTAIATFDAIGRELDGVHSYVGDLVQRMAGLSAQAGKYLQRFESLLQLNFESGVENSLTGPVAALERTAAALTACLEAALRKGEISPAALYDPPLAPYPGLDPRIHPEGKRTSPLDAFADRIFPEFQEPMLGHDPNIVFCVFVTPKGYLPRHNDKFSRPLIDDVTCQSGETSDLAALRVKALNVAQSRHQTLFDDPTGLAAASNATRKFLFKAYIRNMGGGKYVPMLDISTPLFPDGRFAGGLRMGYRMPGVDDSAK